MWREDGLFSVVNALSRRGTGARRGGDKTAWDHARGVRQCSIRARSRPLRGQPQGNTRLLQDKETRKTKGDRTKGVECPCVREVGGKENASPYCEQRCERCVIWLYTNTYNKSTTYLRAMRETAEASASSQCVYIRAKQGQRETGEGGDDERARGVALMRSRSSISH